MVWTESAGSTKWQATVDRIDRIADTNSGTYGVRLSMNNPDHLIPVGLRCRVHFLPETTVGLVAPGSSTAVPADLAPIEPVAGSPCGWLGPMRACGRPMW